MASSWCRRGISCDAGARVRSSHPSYKVSCSDGSHAFFSCFRRWPLTARNRGVTVNCVRVLRTWWQRVAAAYPAGLRASLRRHAPKRLEELQTLEDRIDALAVAECYGEAALAALEWELAWKETIAHARVRDRSGDVQSDRR